jgi:hypothetical protein
MCKLLIIRGLNGPVGEFETTLKKIAESMNKTERDGLGITASIKGKSKIYAKKFLNPLEASFLVSPVVSPFSETTIEESYSLSKEDVIEDIIIHGRTSTNSLGLINTHPLSKNGIHLSHNGVVEDSGPAFEKKTDNDTELLLERYLDGIESIEKYISGYYAFATLEDNTKNLHIVRDNIAPLYYSKYPYRGFVVECFATTKELIKIVNEFAENIVPVLDNVSIFYGPDGLKTRHFLPKGRTKYSDNLSFLSLGKELGKGDSGLISERDLYEIDSDSFLFEIEQSADDSWTFLLDGETLSLSDFFELNYSTQLLCTVIRSDGTICSADDMLDGRLFGS